MTTWPDLLKPGDATDFFTRCAPNKFPSFEPDAAGYSRNNALWLAELSRLVYRHDEKEGTPAPSPNLDNFLKSENFTKLRFFLDTHTDTQAMLVKSNGPVSFAVLVFRGTEQVIKDFITDLKIGKFFISGSKKEMHEGFKDALDSVWKDIAPELDKLPNDCPVFYTGHSLGAALATLAIAKRPPKALYTFGSPQVGNQTFIDSLPAIPIYRIVDDEDLVTRLPPESMEFKHVGKEIALQEKNSKIFLAWLKYFQYPPKCLADHAPINYVNRI